MPKNKAFAYYGVWWFQTGEQPTAVYVCEVAIDAISLYELHHKEEKKDPVVYVSIGGAAKQLAIDRIKRHTRVILAVDNDKAGSYNKNPPSSVIGIIIPPLIHY